jgi:putative intracellular protease/amidase
MRLAKILTTLGTILLFSANGFSAEAPNQKKAGLKMKRALIVVTNHDQKGSTGKKTGWYLSEVTHVYYPLISAGYQVDFASPKGGFAPLDESSRDLEDPENKKFIEDASLMKKMSSTLALSAIQPNDYRIIHFAGGHGTMWDFHNSEALNQVTAAIYESGGIVSAVCHGPAALVNVKLRNGTYLVQGKTVSAFTNDEERAVGLDQVVPFLLQTKLEERGALIQAGKNWQDQLSVSERLVTGQNPQSAKSVGRKIVELSRKLF